MQINQHDVSREAIEHRLHDGEYFAPNGLLFTGNELDQIFKHSVVSAELLEVESSRAYRSKLFSRNPDELFGKWPSPQNGLIDGRKIFQDRLGCIHAVEKLSVLNQASTLIGSSEPQSNYGLEGVEKGGRVFEREFHLGYAHFVEVVEVVEN